MGKNVRQVWMDSMNFEILCDGFLYLLSLCATTMSSSGTTIFVIRIDSGYVLETGNRRKQWPQISFQTNDEMNEQQKKRNREK